MSIDDGVLYTCSGADECPNTTCYHKNPHKHIAGCESSCQSLYGGIISAKCGVVYLDIKTGSEHAHELLNVISMAAGEGVEYDFTEDLAKKLGEFIDGGV